MPSLIPLAAKLALVEPLINNPTKIALYTPEASIDSLSNGYTPQHEVSDSSYEPGGVQVAPSAITQGSRILLYVPVDPTWPAANFTFRYALWYNSSNNSPIVIIDYGADVVCTGNTLSLQFPPIYNKCLLYF